MKNGRHQIGSEMRKNILAFLATMFLFTACASSSSTPYVLPPLPTPPVAYQIVGSTKYTAMVVVDPKSNTDRAGLMELGNYLCSELDKCKVWFWDDINKADTSYPVDPDKEQTLIAFYAFNYADWKGELKVYTLGDAR
jgi:hypothetical protein